MWGIYLNPKAHTHPFELTGNTSKLSKRKFVGIEFTQCQQKCSC